MLLQITIKNSQRRALRDFLRGSQHYHTLIISYDAKRFHDDDLTTLETLAKLVVIYLRGATIIIYPKKSTETTNSQAVVYCSPRQSNTPLSSRSLFMPVTNSTRKKSTELLSTSDISHSRTIQNLLYSISFDLFLYEQLLASNASFKVLV